MGYVVVDSIVIHWDEASDFGVNVPDLPGCVPAGEDVELDGRTLAYVDVDVDKLSTEPERVNVTLPKWLIAMIDSVAGNRSKFLAELAMKSLEAERGKAV